MLCKSDSLPGGYVPNRPSNAWMLYRTYRAAQDRGRGDHQETPSKTYAAEWDALSDKETQPFYDVYHANKSLFCRRFPRYHYKRGARSKWLKQTTEYGIHVAHEWSTKNDHLFALDEKGAVVHTPSVIPDACDSPKSRSTSPSSSLQSPDLAFMDIADEASTPVVPFHLRYIQAVEYADQRLLPSCLLYQDYESATTKLGLSTHFELVSGDDLDMISALQFNPLNAYEPGDPAPCDYLYY